MRVVHLVGTIEQQVERRILIPVNSETTCLRRSALQGLRDQEVEKLHGSGIGPLQVIEDEHKWLLCCQSAEVVGNGAVEIAPFGFRPQWLRLRQLWQLETHFGHDLR